jgi:hypothetical protein
LREQVIQHQRDERLAILTSFVVVGAIASALVALPSREFVLELFGSELALRFTGPVQTLALLLLLLCGGLDALVRTPAEVSGPSVSSEAPSASPFLYRAAYYALPVTVTTIGVVAVHSLQWWGYVVAAGVLLGLLLAGVIAMQRATHTLSTPTHRLMRLVLNAIAYALALGLFGLIFATRVRSVVTASATMLIAGLLSTELYRNSTSSPARIWLYAGLTGLLMGQLTWALNYGAFSTTVGAALLLLAFYAATGIVQQHLWNRLTQRVMIEYIVVYLVGLAAIALFARAV